MDRDQVEALREQIGRMEDYIMHAIANGDRAAEARYVARHAELCAKVPTRRLDTDLY